MQFPHARSVWKNVFCALLCMASFFLAAGCGPPSVRETYEYHHRYDRMGDEYDPPVSLVFLNPGSNLGIYTDMVVGEFRAGEKWIEDMDIAAHYAGTYFRQVLARELFESGHFYVELDPQHRSDSPTAVIEGKFTVFDSGAALARFLSAYLFFLQPTSAVDLQVEGRIRDAHSGETVMEFADRRRFLGHTPWGPTFKTLNDEWAMKQTCILTARSIVNLIIHLREE